MLLNWPAWIVGTVFYILIENKSKKNITQEIVFSYEKFFLAAKYKQIDTNL